MASAGCDDPLKDGVDYTNCRFSEGQDLQGSFLPNSNLSFASFIQVNLDKSIMMNSNLSFGTFPESTFVRANLYETVSIGANFEKTNFTSANLTRGSGATIFSSSNSDNVVDFNSGTKDVFCTLPASKSVYLDSTGTPVGAASAGFALAMAVAL